MLHNLAQGKPCWPQLRNHCAIALRQKRTESAVLIATARLLASSSHCSQFFAEIYRAGVKRALESALNVQTAHYNDCCIVHSTSTRADPELVGGGGGGWSCMLLLHPAPTCAELVLTFAPCTLTFAPCPYGGCHWPIYGGGVSPSAIGTNTPVAHVVVSPIVTCAGGVFPSTHWRRYRTCAQVTCTVWWWFFGGGGGVFLVVAVVAKCISINTPCIMRYAMGFYISTFAANCYGILY